jgi:hypothetical protein
MNSLNIDINYDDLLLILGIFLIQYNGIMVNILGLILILYVIYIDINKKKVNKNNYIIIDIISKSTKKKYNIYNNILESIYTNKYSKIDVMNTYNVFIKTINELEYDYSKLNNFLDICCFLAKMDNVLYQNKKWTKRFINDGSNILDIYAKLINTLHNMSKVDNFDKLYYELNNLENYDNIKDKLTIFFTKYNDNNIINLYQL